MPFDPIPFLERAVRTPSDEDVTAMRDLLVETIASHGLEATVDDAGNVLASRGSGSPHLVLNTHVDTVPPHVPFEREGGTIRGRGSCDAKGPLAALLAGFLDSEPAGRLTLAVTPDEERLSTGAAALIDGAGSPVADADGFVVGEPTGLDVCTAARGRFEAVVTLRGENAHAADPAEGVNAVSAAARVLDALATFDDREDGPPRHPDLGPPTLSPTVVRGGAATNQIPDECAVTVDRRSVPPESAEGFRDALAAHLRAAIPDGVGVEVALADRPTPFLEAFETPADSGLVRRIAAASGGAVRPFGAATEASYFARIAPTVVFGPGELFDEDGPVAHSDREYVRVNEVEVAARVVEALVEDPGFG